MNPTQPNPTQPNHGTALSARECEVLKLIARGYGDREIAQTLGIKKRTIRFHVGNILGKLTVKNRTEAAYYAFKRGWIND